MEARGWDTIFYSREVREVAGEEKNKTEKAAPSGKANAAAQRARKVPPKGAPAGVSAAGVSLVWVVVVVALMLIEGIYMSWHSASAMNALAKRAESQQSRALQAQQRQLSLAADSLQDAARYASEENYGLKDAAVANAKQMVELALLLADEAQAAGLRGLLEQMSSAEQARGTEVSTQLQDMSERLRSMAPSGTGPYGKAAQRKGRAEVTPGKRAK